MFAWWLGILFNLIFNLKKLISFYKQKNKILEIIEKSPEKISDFKTKIELIDSSIMTHIRNIIKCLGDLLPASAGWGNIIRINNKIRNFFE